MRAASAHRRECLVAWSIQEGDRMRLFVRADVDDLVRTDMLGDSARFLGRHVRLPDGIKD